jgi:glycosyltransferase involved in cell wall biosynthesis
MLAAIDYRPALFQAFGIGRYVKNLVRALLAADPELSLDLLAIFHRGLRARSFAHEWPDRARARYVGVPCPARVFAILRRLGLGADLLLRRYDVWHDVDYAPCPVRRGPRVVTLYDVAYFAGRGHVTAAQSKKMLGIVRGLLRGDPEIVTISRTAKEELVRAFALDPSRVHVTPLGADPVFATPGGEDKARQLLTHEGVRGPFVVALGTIEPRKNLLRLVRAFAALRRERGDLSLVLLGRAGWRAEELFAEIDRAGLREAVKWLGPAPDATAAALVREASCLAFPSLEEGFGLPVIEAMSAGTPVACSELPVLREIAGGAAEFFDPLDEAALTRALLRACDPALRAEFRALGLRRAAGYTWRATAEGTLAAYRAAISRGAAR